MSKERCEGCGEAVEVAGGIGDMWTGGSETGGMTLELADGSEFFLCFQCIDRLPEDRAATAADVEALEEA